MPSSLLMTRVSMASIFVLCLAARSADAQTDRQAQARQRFAEATAAYDAGDFPRAAEGFLSAYRVVPSPEIAFNIGRVHERMGELDVAIRYYEIYLRGARLPEGQATPIRATLDRLREERRRRAEEIRPTPPSRADLNAEARAFFDRGTRMFRRRDFAGALQAFEAAYRFARLPELYFNIAVTYERLGRKREAANWYEDYVRRYRDGLSESERAGLQRRIEGLRGEQ